MTSDVSITGLSIPGFLGSPIVPFPEDGNVEFIDHFRPPFEDTLDRTKTFQRQTLKNKL